MKIEYHYENDFVLQDEKKYSHWLSRIIVSENADQGRLTYIFCDDSYLLKLNKKFLEHDTFTDIITFEYADEEGVSGDVFISTERVKENANYFKVDSAVELRRVMAHGVLHLLGYNDKSENDKALMRNKEDEKMKLFHVEQSRK